MTPWYVTVYIKTPFASILLIDDSILYHLMPITKEKAKTIFFDRVIFLTC